MRDEFGTANFTRKHQRKAYRTEVHFSVESRAYPAQIENISRGGASVKTDGPPRVEKGQEIIIQIPFQNSDKSVKRRARVMWVRDTQFGIEFV
jgi:hypothetical protein